MSNLINPKPRFALHAETGDLYDYVAQRDVAPTDEPYEAVDGTWDLIGVRDAILAGANIEASHLTVKQVPAHQPKPATAPAADVPVVADQPVTTGQLSTDVSAAGNQPVTGLSVEQLQALGLTPLQMAAMGITPAQLNATGVTATQVQNWALTAARADALQLTQAQRAVLMA